MSSALRDLCKWPLIVAPMAGGPTTCELVAAAGEAGALGFLAAGYRTADAMAADIATLRASSPRPFGVNVFVPQPTTADPDSVAVYLHEIEPDARHVGTEVGDAHWDDDGWDAKLERLIADPPATVSFTFGCPPPEIVRALSKGGALVGVTVTHPAEALGAIEAGADYVIAQGLEAGGHRGTFADHGPERDLPLLDLVRAIRDVTDSPIVGAGGISDAAGAAAMLAAGASGVQIGTAFLRCPESGTRQVHKDALVDPRFTTTAITRAFTGRRARGLANRFMAAHPDAPSAYPEIHHATRPMRAAATAAGDADRVNLWAGTGFREASTRSAGEVVEELASAWTA